MERTRQTKPLLTIKSKTNISVFLSHLNQLVHQPYQDCWCDFKEMSNLNPTCVYTTLSDIGSAKRLKRSDEDEGLLKLKKMPRYDINNNNSKNYTI